MGTDLHAPLGQNRRPGRQRRLPPFGRILGGLCLIAIACFSLYSALQRDELQKTRPIETAKKEDPAPTAEIKPAPNDQAALTEVDPQSGANTARIVTGDGSVVTMFSPTNRDGSGPVLINANQVGQDPRMAATPNENLLEDSPFGKLPITAPSGLRPMDQYARPWSGARGIRIAIVVSGLGLSQTGTQRAIEKLPEEITLAFAASGNSLQRWMQEARRGGHELLIQAPFEPFDYPSNNPGPDTLLTSLSSAKNIDNLHKAMGKITNYIGVMNYLGGRFLANPNALEPVLRDVGKRGLLFLDDGSSAQSKSGTLSKTLEVPHAFADIQLDGELQQDAILKKLDELERIARRNGSAIGVASAFDESVDAISKWSEEAAMRGIEIVAVSALADDPKHP
ncbi:MULTISPECIES: divergent polysaccharide deacetylase family protein [unclassified Rhizobium]|uniref:divergent polysaccharide deacetylase family protein n=1 Tax=unclassified Rhizobium TaxID=2613769 RepID=UPI000EA8FB63|nr:MULTISPECIES: divergent polysaccharide deacetylase family protein [unclassified Rhizobium]AYG67944.1 divergent polysaccharide deacetylase family protein [Rhizobium sp. CCGE531]AYG74334.1 divergent polysaccharide deacetylase family protein [Rhizobium sp. CCGE532]